jgi:hypothetical protein
MDSTTASVIALGILALVAIAFLAVFRGKGSIDFKGLFGTRLKAKGENPSPPAAVPSGIKIEDAEAGQNLRAHSTGPGGVQLTHVKAKTGDIDATSSPGSGQPPPK